MGQGTRYNNLQIADGEAWHDKFAVTDSTTKANLDVLMFSNGGVIGWWKSATAFSSAAKADCINFPIGAIVYDMAGNKIYMKTAAAGTDTWKTGAIAT